MVAMMARLMWQLYWAMASQGWARTQGHVRNAEVKETGSDSPSYEPRIDFEYVAGKTLYRAHRLSYGLGGAGSKKRAQRLAEMHPPGTPATVWYDPSKPSRATLHTGGCRGVAVMLLIVSLLGPLILFAATDAGRRFLDRLGIHQSSDASGG